MIAGNGPLHTSIAAKQNLWIDWRFENATMPTPIALGTSKNPAYWVLLAPTGNFPLCLSLIDIGCTRAHGMFGGGTPQHVAIANAIFGEFATLQVVRSSDILEGVTGPQALTYWDKWCNPVWATDPSFSLFALSLGQYLIDPGLLNGGDGRCQSWADFFVRCMHAVGIDPADEKILIRLPPTPEYAQVMLVKNWNPIQSRNVNGPFGNPFKHINIPSMVHGYCEFIVPGSPGSYVWVLQDVFDLNGVSGQGVTVNPQSIFSNHSLVRVGTNFYDPSYGAVYTDAQSVDDIFWGFGRAFGCLGAPTQLGVDEGHVNFDLDGDGFATPGNIVNTPAIITQGNPSGVQVEALQANSSR